MQKEKNGRFVFIMIEMKVENTPHNTRKLSRRIRAHVQYTKMALAKI